MAVYEYGGPLSIDQDELDVTPGRAFEEENLAHRWTANSQTAALDLEFGAGQQVEISDQGHEWYGSVGVITRLVGNNFYIVQVNYVEEEIEVSGEQIVPHDEDDFPF